MREMTGSESVYPSRIWGWLTVGLMALGSWAVLGLVGFAVWQLLRGVVWLLLKT